LPYLHFMVLLDYFNKIIADFFFYTWLHYIGQPNNFFFFKYKNSKIEVRAMSSGIWKWNWNWTSKIHFVEIGWPISFFSSSYTSTKEWRLKKLFYFFVGLVMGEYQLIIPLFYKISGKFESIYFIWVPLFHYSITRVNYLLYCKSKSWELDCVDLVHYCVGYPIFFYIFNIK
jgi:hypothetical protein